MVILDIMAGNRHIYGGHVPGEILERRDSGEPIVYMDIEAELKIPPDVICDLKHLPIRDRVASLIVADPPYWNFGTSRFHGDPKEAQGSWWGNFKNLSNLRILIVGIVKTSRRVLRVDGCLYLKWCDVIYLWSRFAPMFAWDFTEEERDEWTSRSRRNTKPCYWIRYRLNYPSHLER